MIGSLPAAPLASTSTVSLVLWHPSTTSALKLSVDRGLRARAAARPAAIDGVGGEHREHRGHRRRQHRRTLGHAADGRGHAGVGSTTGWCGLLAHGVGGEQRVGGGERRRRRRRSARPPSFGMPDSTGSIGIGMPMRPVWHTSTSVVAQPERLRGELAHAAARRPDPAPPSPRWRCPELRTTAAARPSARCRRLICTGAAATRLVVNTPAAVTGAPVGGRDDGEVGRARRLDAGREPARPKPATAVTLIAARSRTARWLALRPGYPGCGRSLTCTGLLTA